MLYLMIQSIHTTFQERLQKPHFKNEETKVREFKYLTQEHVSGKLSGIRIQTLNHYTTLPLLYKPQGQRVDRNTGDLLVPKLQPLSPCLISATVLVESSINLSLTFCFPASGSLLKVQEPIQPIFKLD